MPKKKVKVAVAGLGFVGGQAHAPAFKKITNADLVAVIDVIEESAQKFASKYNIKYYLDHNEALKDPEIDAVVVAVPTPFHFQIVTDCIANGKHVLCEMPLTPTVDQSKKLGNDAKKAGVILMPDLNFRFTPNYVKAKELILQGAIGNPITINFSEFIPAKDLAKQWPSGSWAWDIEKSGGYPDFTLSVWSIDLARWITDAEINDVDWFSNYSPLEGIENYRGYNTTGIIKLSNGAVGTLHYCATVASGLGTSRLEIFGDNTNVLEAKWNNHLKISGASSELEWNFKEKGTRVWGHYQIDSHFVDCILQKKKPEVTVEDAVKAQTIASKMIK
ncbi:MAG: Gfo/Idh/MocA family oxidoreductase [Candidatus Bathyarchaeota archaeon]|nr:Gfo/Idh/MocA family oxidoreductase [Candidatus Bathyarchaeota archaeon]